MIEATRKKLRETRFFLARLFNESKRVVRNEPDAFQFYLSAFLSAARSVTFALQWEEKGKYDAWFSTWLDNRTDDDHKVLSFLKTQRNIEQKQGGAEVAIAWECVPATEVQIDDRWHPAYYGFHSFGPPGIPPATVGRAVHYFELGSSEAEVTAICKRYTDLLDELVRDFIHVHSS